METIVDILHFFNEIVIEFDILAWIFEYLLANFSEFELSFNFLQNITYHKLNPFRYDVQIVVFVELVPRIEDVVDCLNVFGGITYLFINDLGFIKQQLVIDVDVFSSQVESVPPEVVQLVHVDAVYLIAYYLKLPVSLTIWLATYESSYSFDLFGLFEKVPLQAKFLDQVCKEHFTCDLMLPFDIFGLSVVPFDGDFCYDGAVKSVTIWAMA